MSAPVAAQYDPTSRIPEQVKSGLITWRWPLVMMVSRTVLFALAQVLVAAVLALAGHTSPWDASAAWWPLTVTVTNLVCLALLSGLLRREGSRLRDLYRIDRAHMRGDLLLLLGLLVIAGPVSYLPNVISGKLLFGDLNVLNALFFRPLPLWAAYLFLILFPVTNALIELPVYYAYVMPRLKALTGSAWLAVALAAFWHGAQHCALPLIFDGRFLLWRLVMFIPFALFAGIVIMRRPRLLPYMLPIHGLMDLSLVVFVLIASMQ